MIRPAAASLLVSLACGHSHEPGPPAPDPGTHADLAGAPQASTEPAPTWADVRAAIESLVCLQEYPEGAGVVYIPRFGDPQQCPNWAAETPLDALVAKSAADASKVVMAVNRAFWELESAVNEHAETADVDRIRRLREVFWTKEELFSPFLLRTYDLLEQQGQTCQDCPPVEKPEPRRLQWLAFSDYVSAYTWVDTVTIDPEQQKPKFDMYACAGVNGVDELENPDEHLTKAGFLVAAHSEVVRLRSRSHAEAIVEEEGFTKATTDDERTAYVRGRLPGVMAADDSLRDEASDVLSQFEWYLGIQLEECTADPTPGEAQADRW